MILDSFIFVFVVKSRFYVVNACKDDSAAKKIYTEYENSMHSVRCCDQDGNICYSHIRNKTTILDISRHCIKENRNHNDAQELCNKSGMRMCTVQEKLSVPNTPTAEQNPRYSGKRLCCTTGCDHDLNTIWTSIKGR